MNIISYSRDQIQEGLRQARQKHDAPNDYIRILFAPVRIEDGNFERACDIYSRINSENYEAIIVIESYDEVLDKKLPMPSHNSFETPLGEVKVNDYMRNEFCDEEDDFFIHDGGFSRDMSLFQQLMMLQCTFGDFSVVSVQIADRGQAIIKELAYVMQEVLAPRRALLIFCCELNKERKDEFHNIKKMIENDNESELLNYVNSGKLHIEGATAFIAGVLVAKAWELELNFLNGEHKDHSGSLLTGYAESHKILL